MADFSKLSEMAEEASKSKKSSVPRIHAPAQLAPLLKELLDAKQAMTKAEAGLADAEAALIPACTELRIKESRSIKNVCTSIGLEFEYKVGEGEIDVADGQITEEEKTVMGVVTFTQATKFLSMKAAECDSHLQAHFGDDYGDYFTKKSTIKVKDDISEDDAKKFIEVMTKAFGPRLKEVIGVTTICEPTKKLVSDMVLNPKVAKKVAEIQESKGLVKLCKPSFKV